ncbi:MAG: YncE family protein [Desulfuromonadales bacterium]|nr:YncE family protein [Desulfuromonadales bacterium]
MKLPVRTTVAKLLAVLWLTLLTAACTAAVRSSTPPPAAAGLFTLFLQPLPQEAHRLTFTVSELAALQLDGGEVPLPLQQSRFEGGRLLGAQTQLANLTLPPGRYRGVAVRIASASVQGEEGPVDLLPPEGRLMIEAPFDIREDQAETLFLSLGADRLITAGALFTPRFALWKPERALINLKGFVSSRTTPSLTVFNKRTAQVLGAIRVGTAPGDLALDQRRGWLYVALSGEDAVVVIEVNSGTILGRVPLRFGDRPTELALTASGNLLVALNPGSSSVSIIDTQALFEKGRVRLNAEAGNLFLGRGETRAFVTHAAASLLSVIDLQNQSLLRTIPLEEAPLDGVAAADGRALYLINDFSAELSVLDAISLSLRNPIFIGNGAVSLKADRAGGLLYVGMNDGRIVVVDPRAAMAIDAFTLPPEPVRALTIDNEENTLLALLPQSRRLLKIDLVSKRELGRLELGPDSQAVAVMGAR